MDAAPLAFPVNSVRIALLDDHPLFRQGLRYILRELPYVGAVVEAGEFAELLALCRQQLPDLVLLDLQLPGIDGPAAARRLLAEFPALKIIVLSMFSADGYISQMMGLGARSYLPKDADGAQLERALADVLATGYHYTPHMVRALARGTQAPAAPPAPPATPPVLTAREQEVLRLICEGHTALEIAALLFISHRTVEGHRQKLLNKTKAPNLAGLVAYAARHGLLHQ